MSDRELGSHQRFFAELKRRHVFRVMAVYGATAFVLLQVADLLAQGMGLPDLVLRVTTFALLLGFPVAVVLAWAFEQTPEGFRRTERADPEEIEAIVAQPVSRRWPAGLLALLGVTALVVGAWWVGRRTAPAPAVDTEVTSEDGLIRSLAVLPLDNLTGDESQAYFVDGMHEALISQLARIGELTVLSRTSTLRYRESDKTMGEIAADLEVDALVEGSVFRAGDTVRITVQLVRGSPEEHLWTEDYVDELSNALALHGRVARAIARQIQLTLSPREAARLAEGNEIAPEAQDAYLRGRALWRTRQLDNLERAVELMEEAVALDPDFALGYAALADAYLIHMAYAPVPPPRDSVRNAYERTREAALRALELDPELPEPHATLGWVAMVDELDWTAAENRIRRSLDLNPSYAQGWDWLADVLGARGRVSEAISAMRRAVELDPFSPLMHRDLGSWLYSARRCEEAEEHLNRALELDPEHFAAHGLLTDCSLLQNDEAQALEHFLNLVPSPVADTLKHAFEASGWDGIDRLIVDREVGPPWFQALAMTRLGRLDEAVTALRAAYELRSPRMIITVKTEPMLDPLRDRLDFQELLEDMGLADLAGQ